MEKKPNILFVMADDHAAHAVSAYGSRMNQTPNIDRIAREGIRFDNCFCTNSICAPSRAVILTGKHSHVNGVTTLKTKIDNTQPMFPAYLQNAGYQTALVGKWHLGHGPAHDPVGFDYWDIFEGQGTYFDPKMFNMGKSVQRTGYATNIVTDLTIDFIKSRDKTKPFMAMCHHEAPHRRWMFESKYANMLEDAEMPYPESFNDDYSGHADAVAMNMNRILWLGEEDLNGLPPEGLTQQQRKEWKYQRYIKKYLRCVQSIDDNIGRLLAALDEEGIAEDTIIIYTSDQGFFLGDHGWFDKRYMYEESMRMPFIIRYPRGIKPGSVNTDLVQNIDFAATFLDYAGLPTPADMQGRSLKPLFEGNTPQDWRKSVYYRYWEYPSDVGVWNHVGVRTKDFKLIHFNLIVGGFGIYPEKNWELFDLEKDPCEMHSLYDDLAYQDKVRELTAELARLKEDALDFEP